MASKVEIEKHFWKREFDSASLLQSEERHRIDVSRRYVLLRSRSRGLSCYDKQLSKASVQDKDSVLTALRLEIGPNSFQRAQLLQQTQAHAQTRKPSRHSLQLREPCICVVEYFPNTSFEPGVEALGRIFAFKEFIHFSEVCTLLCLRFKFQICEGGFETLRLELFVNILDVSWCCICLQTPFLELLDQM